MLEANGAGPAPIPEDHSLRRLYHSLVTKAFGDTRGQAQQEIVGYLSKLLADFAHCDNLYRVRDAQGARLTEVSAMLAEADITANATSFDQERAVHKHIGDFTLFWAGVYPEALRQLRAPAKADAWIDYVQQGKQSYYIVSTFAYGRYAGDAPLFRRLSEEFELCLHGLQRVRREWEQLAAPRQS